MPDCRNRAAKVSRKPLPNTRAEDLHAHAGTMVWWRGKCGHVYRMAVRDRVRAKPGYCPYCSGRKRPERPMRLD